MAPMRILQFGFGNDEDSSNHLPHNYAPLTAAYTGNHDNNTFIGWFEHLRPAQQRRTLTCTGGDATRPHAAAVRALMASPANLVIFPMQDVLGLDERARMNVPGTIEGNWQWRLPAVGLDRPARWLRELTRLFDRGPETMLARRQSQPPRK
jgi:4-alpha-glucanotransferase